MLLPWSESAIKSELRYKKNPVNSAPSLRRLLYIQAEKRGKGSHSMRERSVNSAINPWPDNVTNIAVSDQNEYSLETKIANLNQFGASFPQFAQQD